MQTFKFVFFAISQKQELIEQNYDHFLFQSSQITLQKLLSTLQLREFFFFSTIVI